MEKKSITLLALPLCLCAQPVMAQKALPKDLKSFNRQEVNKKDTTKIKGKMNE